MNKQRALIIFAVSLFQWLLPLQGYCQTQAIANGLTWLNSVQQADGSWGDWSTPIMRNTAVAAEAYQVIDPTLPSYSAALQWLATAGSANNDYVARRLYVFSKTINDISADLNFLMAGRKSDGGWGLDSESESGIINTALVLQALRAASYADNTNLFQTISYLMIHQNDEGGWGNNKGYETSYESDVYTTALVLKALSHYSGTFQIQDSIQKAASYLLLKQNPDGGFGNSPSTIYETALSLISLIESGQGQAQPLQNAINYLVTSQSTDGSWNQDPYTTALALRALAYVKPNLSIAASDIALSKVMPTLDEAITITATVRNTGLDSASNIVVRFYSGDPASGGTQIGTDQIIPLLAVGASAQVSINQAFSATGSKTIYVQVDPNNQIAEISKADNTAFARLWVATAPDIAIFSEDIKPSTFTPASGTPFTLEYTIRNLGESAVNGFDVAVYDGDPNANGGQGQAQPLQTTHISGLNGTEVRTGTFGVTLTGDGGHTLYVVADSGNLVSESSKTNNTANVTVTVGGEQTAADLAVTSADITLNPSRPSQGDSVAITARVRNQGMEAANNFLFEIYDGAPESGGVLINSQTVSSLPAAGELTITANWAITSGIHDIYVIVDKNNKVIETDENNNKTSVRIMPDMVDISISATDLTFNPSHPVIGDAVALTITAHNQGIRNTGAFNVTLYDGDPNANGGQGQALPLQTYQIANIPGDGSATLTYTFTAEAKTYRFYAVADTEHTVTELYEENNTAIRSLKIKAPGEILGPDLVPIKIDLTGTTTDPQTLAISGTAKVTLQNKGDAKISTPFNVIVFEDKDNDGKYTQGVDTLLGTATNTLALWPEGANIVDVSLSGTVQFLHSPLYAMVDSGDAILEQEETNNLMRTGADCEVRPEKPIEPVLKWKWRSGKSQCSDQVVAPPVITYLIDDNGDGKVDGADDPYLLFLTSNDGYCGAIGALHAVNGKTGKELFTTSDPNHKFYAVAYIAAGDINNDGFPEIIIPRAGQYGGDGLICYKHDGTLLWDNAAMLKAWRQTNPLNSTTLHEAAIPIIADVDADGHPEIIVGPTAVNGDGTIKWGCRNCEAGKGGGVFGYNAVTVDLDMDGRQEIVAGNTAYNYDSTIKWWNKTVTDGITAVGNLDGDPYPEVVLVTWITQYPHPYSARIYLLDHNGNIKWGPVYLRYLEGVNISVPGGPPVIADFDGDGEVDIGIKGWNKYFILDNNGNVKNTLSIPYNGNGSDSAPTVFDLNGDGRPEVLRNSDSYFRIFDGRDGTLLYKEGFGGWGNYQNVVIADVDGDKQAEVVAFGGYGGWYSNGPQAGINVYGSKNNDWVNARKIWNQATYHVTNVNDDGTIPQYNAPSWLLNNTYRCQARVGESPNPYLTPNLTASYLRAIQDSTSVNLTVRVGNGGAKEAQAGATVIFYDGDPSTGAVIGTAATTKARQPGEYQDITFSWSGVGEGSHQIYAVIDGANSVAECREDDNEAQLDYTIQAGLPDLKVGVEDITLPSGPYMEGSLIPVTARVNNIGTVQAANVTVRLYYGNPLAGGMQVDDRTIQNIGAGGTAETQFIYDTLGHGGANILYVSVDPDNHIVETNETDNLALFTLYIQPPVLPNLSVRAEDILIMPLSPKEGEPLQITANITNRGAAVGNIPVSIYLGDPSNGGILISEQTIYPIRSLGQAATVQATFDTTGWAGQQSVYIKIDPANAIKEGVEDDNTASKSVFIQSAGIAATLILDKSIYQAVEPVVATISVSNTSASLRSLSLVLTVKDSAGNVIVVIPHTGLLNIEANGTVTMSKSWNTGKTLAGSYTITAEFSAEGRVVSRKSANFTITPDKRLDTKVTADKIQYNPKENVALTSVITSMSENYIFEDLAADVNVSDQRGVVLFTETRSIASLMPGSLFTFKAHWNTSSYPKGTYKATLKIRSGGTVTNTTSTAFEILGTSKTGGGLAGTITAAPSPVYQGRDEDITYTVTNSGNEDIANLNIKVLFVDPDTGEVKAEVGGQWSVVRNSAVNETRNIATSGLAPKTYLAILQAEASGNAKTLASATFEVLPGIEIKASMPDYARMLVWLNDGCIRNSDQLTVNSEQQDKCIRQDFVEKVLKEIGVTYHIVSGKKEFQKELKNNYYTDFMMLGNFNPLEDHYGEELRERVYSGKGLITSPWIGESEGDMLGLKVQGKLRQRDNIIEISEGDIFKGQLYQSFGEAVKIEASPDNVLGWITYTTNKGSSKYPAIIKKEYGNGKALYFAFDLGLSAKEENYAQLVEILISTVNYTHTPDNTLTYYPYDLVPVRIDMKSLGAEFDLKASVAYPGEIKIFDSLNSAWSTENPWEKEIHLDANETENINLFALTPDAVGTYTITTDISYLEDGADKPYQTLSTEMKIEKDAYTLTTDILYKLATLYPTSEVEMDKLNEAKAHLETVRDRTILDSKDINSNIHEILKAIEAILKITSADIKEIRLDMDRLLAVYGEMAYLSP